MRTSIILNERLRMQASRPSLHVCSIFPPSMPHFPLQVPPRPQQLSAPFGLVPHLGHLFAAVTAEVDVDVVAAIRAVWSVKVIQLKCGREAYYHNGAVSARSY